MASLGMSGPYKFEWCEFDNRIQKKSPGNYALGYVNKEDTFIVQYVGRADSDLNDRIKDHFDERYTHFKFSYATSPMNAYLKECQNYHDFGMCDKLKNKIHPDRPNGSSWKCPVCD